MAVTLFREIETEQRDKKYLDQAHTRLGFLLQHRNSEAMLLTTVQPASLATWKEDAVMC